MNENLHNYVLLCFIFFLFFNALQVKSEIKTIKLSSETRSYIPLHDFGFGNDGFISLTVSSVSIITTTTSTTILNPVKLSLIGCFYAPSLARQAMKHALMEDICLIGKPLIFPLFTFNHKIIMPKSHFKTNVPVTIPDLYYIFFVNCAQNSSASVTLNVKTYNVRSNGDPDYIDDQFTPLPTILSVFALFYFVFFVTWSYMCYKSKPFIQNIHILMSGLLLIRFLELFCHANSQHSIRRSGSAHRRDVLWLTMYVVRSVLFTIVIMLLGTGWSLVKPALQELKKCTMAIAILLQLVACTCFILIREIGPSDVRYRYWIAAYYATDFLCCITMTAPVRASIYKLDVNTTEGREPRRWGHKNAFENFALALYVYVGFTRFFLFVLRAITTYNLWCLTIALDLLVESFLYSLVYSTFWPKDWYDYSALEDRTEQTRSAALPAVGAFEFDLKRSFSSRFLRL